MEQITRLAIMASGNGTNLSAIVDWFQRVSVAAQIVRVIVDQPQAPVIQRAEHAGLPVTVVDYHDYPKKADAEAVILRQLAADHVDAVVLAGFMRILSPQFVARYPRHIVNLHPALLPSFPGRHGIEDAYQYGVKITGVTVHFVNDGVDSGEIIAQSPVAVYADDTVASLATRIHETEHQLYPKTLIELINQGELNHETSLN
ncbi:phosphoribosylglycinamide formyltransferase [Fructilactobacillus cliffordii]|uniref:phosphoribosylglycinamide formyltransferase n=1 Tax=Fructilactobacillus cliffordii TaxID=2940299 RepID=UPI002093DDC0|nr:phosphoribosylglycinamide formyltransferase [Fructilactobacillus cliffordii]USS86245.1 phosphoribosylglycinamide formyltransferase [Fructilactobacillus cliffordii]